MDTCENTQWRKVEQMQITDQMACLRRCIITLAAFITKSIIHFKEIDQNLAFILNELDQNLVCLRKLVFLKVKVIFTNMVNCFVVFDPCCQKLLKEGSLSLSDVGLKSESSFR